MSYTQIVKEQTLNENIDKVWEFMSSPKNLEEITPNEMSFNITSSNKDEKMYEGMIGYCNNEDEFKEKFRFFLDTENRANISIKDREHIRKFFKDNSTKEILDYLR